jgi:hypothetical protein
MKTRVKSALVVLAAILLGVAIGRAGSGTLASAETLDASPKPMASGMPMHGGMMENCPAMQTMMQRAHSPADRALMQSMMSMHESMQSMHLTGDADHDFLAMMIPHHEMAVAMATAELKNGKDARVLTLAKSIIAAQQKEIDEMRAWLH